MSDRSRLYLISPPVVDDIAAFARAFSEAITGGDVACLQIRLKDRSGTSATDSHICRTVEKILPIARAADIAVMINDRPDLAVELGADGAHIGQTDWDYQRARDLIGPDGIVGVTCHDSRHLALEAGEAGADYVAFGAFFETDTKDPSARADIALLEWWSHATTVQSVAIGGITTENCSALVRAGADFLAVSGGVWRHPDGPQAAVTAFTQVIGAA